MADFISEEGIHFNDFNEEFNYYVCIEETDYFDDEEQAGSWSANIETKKVFNPDQENDAVNYALRLVQNLSEFKKGSLVVLSAHKKLFNFV